MKRHAQQTFAKDQVSHLPLMFLHCAQAGFMQGDSRFQGFNLQDRVNAFVAAANEYAAVGKGWDVMFLMGTDFTYANAQAWYSNLDRLIAAVNKDGRVSAFYSSPPQYLAAKHASNITWALKVDDFFPYADGPSNFWTGVGPLLL
jgi:alpha-mannosidase